VGGAVVLGEALIDLLEGRVAGEDEPVYRPAVGGGPLNVAVAVARLGGAAEFVGSLGDDALADRIAAFLASAGVGLAGVVRVPAPTTLAVTTFSGAEPDFRFYGQPPSYGLITPADLDTDRIAAARVLYCGSICLLCPPVLAAARRAWSVPGPLRVFDPNVRPRLLADPRAVGRILEEFAATADVVKLSAADATALYGESAEQTARRLRGLGAAAVVVTAGARGALVAAGDEVLAVPSPDGVDAVDATGAGDSVMGALIWRLLRADPPEDVARWRPQLEFALRVAGLVCESPGGATAMPTLAELEARWPDLPR
jgi:sugar/nucleoside kinase (ribokinase family)